MATVNRPDSSSEQIADELRGSIEKYEALRESSPGSAEARVIKESLRATRARLVEAINLDNGGDEDAALEDDRFDDLLQQTAVILDPPKPEKVRNPGVDRATQRLNSYRKSSSADRLGGW